MCILRFEFIKHNRIVDVPILMPFPYVTTRYLSVLLFLMQTGSVERCKDFRTGAIRTAHFVSLVSILNTIHCNHNAGLIFKAHCLTLYIIVVLYTTAQSFIWYVSYVYYQNIQNYPNVVQQTIIHSSTV